MESIRNYAQACSVWLALHVIVFETLSMYICTYFLSSSLSILFVSLYPPLSPSLPLSLPPFPSLSPSSPSLSSPSPSFLLSPGLIVHFGALLLNLISCILYVAEAIYIDRLLAGDEDEEILSLRCFNTTWVNFSKPS